MKQSVLMLVLLIFSIPMLAFNHQDGLTGYWHHKGLDRTISIKEQAGLLIVKGLPGKRTSRFFDFVGHATYRDEAGNYIVVKNSDQLVYLHKKSHKKFRFKKVSGQRKSWQDQTNQSHHNKDKWDNDPGEFEWQEQNRQTNNSQNHPDISKSKVEGSWKTTDNKYIVAILETREGLKAKFSGTTRWVDYTRKENRPFDFVDNKGNYYTFLSEKEAHWTAAEGNRQTIRLYKISDEVQY